MASELTYSACQMALVTRQTARPRATGLSAPYFKGDLGPAGLRDPRVSELLPVEREGTVVFIKYKQLLWRCSLSLEHCDPVSHFPVLHP